MSKWIYLSHFLSETTPAYGNGESFKSVQRRSMERNDSCNAGLWTMSNHLGTHIDCPRHFSKSGKTLSEYAADFWLFFSVVVVDISPITPEQHIDLTVLPVENIPVDVDLLIVKTGFGKMRGDSMYWSSNPSFSPDLADALRERCPNLRAMGFDTISLSPWTDRDLGRQTHRAFLDTQRPILLIEDMDLTYLDRDTSVKQVIIGPLPVKDSDASPCMVICEVKL